ncbi:MAG: helix-turn-helix domain-containing protein [Gammaproteobacteria bacterium]|nr:helix-turn-helix domain-containing protein [Gammaproteobacteria bacterium]
MEQLVTTSEALGHALKRARRLRGLNQTDAGQPFNLSQRTVSTLEQGAPGTRLETLFRMLAALDLEIVVCTKPPRDNLSNENW